MRLDDVRESANVEDRRGIPPASGRRHRRRRGRGGPGAGAARGPAGGRPAGAAGRRQGRRPRSRWRSTLRRRPSPRARKKVLGSPRRPGRPCSSASGNRSPHRSWCSSPRRCSRPAAPPKRRWARSTARSTSASTSTWPSSRAGPRFGAPGRLRPGLCHRARGRPPRAEPARRLRAGARARQRARPRRRPTRSPCAWSCRPTASPASGRTTRRARATSWSRATSRRACAPPAPIGDDTPAEGGPRPRGARSFTHGTSAQRRAVVPPRLRQRAPRRLRHLPQSQHVGRPPTAHRTGGRRRESPCCGVRRLRWDGSCRCGFLPAELLGRGFSGHPNIVEIGKNLIGLWRSRAPAQKPSGAPPSAPPVPPTPAGSSHRWWTGDCLPDLDHRGDSDVALLSSARSGGLKVSSAWARS